DVHVPVIAFGGSVDPAVEAALRTRGVRCVPILPAPASLQDAMRDTEANLRSAAARVSAFLSGC
ncbi:MAG: glycerate kinase, partial [Candidatus Eremiobacteraeota bacterium]|nr:glycerate kinase [Candidatus Eremiobacteraeota bacterium]